MIYLFVFLAGFLICLNLCLIFLMVAIGRKILKLEDRMVAIKEILDDFFGVATELIESSPTKTNPSPSWEENYLEEERARRRMMSANLIDPSPPRRNNWGAPPAPEDVGLMIKNQD